MKTFTMQDLEEGMMLAGLISPKNETEKLKKLLLKIYMKEALTVEEFKAIMEYSFNAGMRYAGQLSEDEFAKKAAKKIDFEAFYENFIVRQPKSPNQQST